MRVVNRLSAVVASFTAASVAFAVTPPIASADECGSGYTFDQAGQCVPAPAQGQDQGSTSGANTGGLPPNLSANAPCG